MYLGKYSLLIKWDKCKAGGGLIPTTALCCAKPVISPVDGEEGCALPVGWGVWNTWDCGKSRCTWRGKLQAEDV